MNLHLSDSVSSSDFSSPSANVVFRGGRVMFGGGKTA